MLGARGQLEDRLKINAEAMRLAPKWPMAHVYYGDTLCRLKRAEQAWPHYMHGFELAPNDLNLIALGLQCAWEEKIIESPQGRAARGFRSTPRELARVSRQRPRVQWRGERGSAEEVSPRAYDEGPKDAAPERLARSMRPLMLR